MENKIIEKHKEFIKNTKNKTILKYFGNIQFFHDSELNEQNFDLFNSKYELKLIKYNGTKEKEYKIVFNKIFETKFINSPNVDEEYLKDLSWKNYFKLKENTEFLYCYFDKSKYSDLSNKYIKKECYKAFVYFENGLIIEIDFLDIIVK